MDSKGRIVLPSKFRILLSTGAVLTRGLDRSLFLYPLEEWEVIAKKLSMLPLSQSNSRAFARLMLSGAWNVEIDKQGRMIIPDSLRKFANLSKRIVCAGLYNRIEVWDQESWDAYKLNTERESEQISEALGALGI